MKEYTRKEYRPEGKPGQGEYGAELGFERNKAMTGKYN
jgi:hypothetical protein